ncbi:MAG TPA: hypothetical protein VJ740_18045 [Hyphomicrobiaceae bacterium]|nr:hypothetical protein [Hyphomicrobiaceae bacterium]
MKTLLSALVGLGLLAGAAAPAAAAEGCTVKWTDGSWSRPVWTCPDEAR